jgi:hypothetical protein
MRRCQEKNIIPKDLKPDQWRIKKSFYEAGNITNPAFETKLSNFVEAYLTFVGKIGAS